MCMFSYMYICLDVSGYIVTTCFSWVRVETTLLEFFFPARSSWLSFSKVFQFWFREEEKDARNLLGKCWVFCAFCKVHHTCCLFLPLFAWLFWGENLSKLDVPPEAPAPNPKTGKKKTRVFCESTRHLCQNIMKALYLRCTKQKTVKFWHKSCGTTKSLEGKLVPRFPSYKTLDFLISCSVTFC